MIATDQKNLHNMLGQLPHARLGLLRAMLHDGFSGVVGAGLAVALLRVCVGLRRATDPLAEPHADFLVFPIVLSPSKAVSDKRAAAKASLRPLPSIRACRYRLPFSGPSS
jgi:hypothetical protein